MLPNLFVRSPQRMRNWLIAAGLVLAMLATGIFATRLLRRFNDRPTYEPVAAWMSVPHVARAYGVPRPQIGELYAAINEPAPELGPGKPPDRRPIGEIANSAGKDSAALVQALQTYLDARPRTGPRDPNVPTPPPGGRPKN
jgi:hypothetical protein